MAQETASLFIKVDSRGVVTASKDLAGLEQAGKKVETGVGGLARVTTSATESMKRDWAALAIKVTAAYMAINQAMKYIELGAKDLQATESFRQVAKAAEESSDRILRAMKRAAAGTVDDSDIMQKAVKGMILGFSGDQMVRIMEAARVSARVTGQDVKTAYEGITDAISTNMTRTLKQYGLITKEQMALVNKAMAAGIEDVGLYEIAMANAADQAAKMGNMSVTAAEKIQIFYAEINALKEELGKNSILVLQGVYDSFRLIAAGASLSAASIMGLLAVWVDFKAQTAKAFGFESRASELSIYAKQNMEYFTTLLETAKSLTDDVLKSNVAQVDSNAVVATSNENAAKAWEDRIEAQLGARKATEDLAKAEQDYITGMLTRTEILIDAINKETEAREKARQAALNQQAGTLGSYLSFLPTRTYTAPGLGSSAGPSLNQRGGVFEFNKRGATEETTKSLDDMGRAIQELGGLVADFNTGLGRTVYTLGNVITQIQKFGGTTGTWGNVAGVLSIASSMVPLVGQLIDFLKWNSGAGGATQGDYSKRLSSVAEVAWMTKQTIPLTYDPDMIISWAGAIERLAGSMDALTKSANTYINAFFTQEEQQGLVLRDLTKTFSVLGGTLPATREGFRTVIEGLDLTTDSGQRAYTALLAAADAADQYYTYLETQAADKLKKAESDLRAAFGAEKTRLTDLYHAELIVMNERLSATQQIIMDLTSGVEKLRSASEKMFPMTMAEAQTSLAVILGQARQGNFAGLKGIDQALNTATGISESSYATRVDYLRDFQKNARMIAELEKLTSGQLTTEEKIATGIQQQISDNEKQYNKQIAAMDAQMNALLGIDTSVLSVAQAVQNLITISPTAAMVIDQEKILLGINDTLLTGDKTLVDAAARQLGLSADQLLAMLGIDTGVRTYGQAQIDELAKQFGITTGQLELILGISDNQNTITKAQLDAAGLQLGISGLQLEAMLNMTTGIFGIIDAIKNIVITIPQVTTTITNIYGTPSESYYPSPANTPLISQTPAEIAKNVLYDLIQDANPDIMYTGYQQSQADIAANLAYERLQDMGYAGGGYHPGGIRVVGERGPELEFTGPSRIMSNQQSKALVDNTELVTEIRVLRAELKAVLDKVNKNTEKTSITLQRVTQGGMAMQTEVYTG